MCGDTPLLINKTQPLFCATSLCHALPVGTYRPARSQIYFQRSAFQQLLGVLEEKLHKLEDTVLAADEKVKTWEIGWVGLRRRVLMG